MNTLEYVISSAAINLAIYFGDTTRPGGTYHEAALFQRTGILAFLLHAVLRRLNDNVFKYTIGILIAYKAYTIGGISSEQMVSLSGGIFILPFFLFSAIAGQLADKYSKTRLIRIVKALEIAIMVLSMIGFIYDDISLLLTALFLMGTHSTLFGPVKYSTGISPASSGLEPYQYRLPPEGHRAREPSP
jgi:MFS family permease